MRMRRLRTTLVATAVLTGAAIGVGAPSASAASCSTTVTTSNYGNCAPSRPAPSWHCVKRAHWWSACQLWRRY